MVDAIIINRKQRSKFNVNRGRASQTAEVEKCGYLNVLGTRKQTFRYMNLDYQ